MIRKLEMAAVYLTGLCQGLVLVTVPAASLIFTGGFGFSDQEYGLLFVPQVLACIAASLLAPALALRSSLKKVYQAGLAFNILAMLLIALSQCFYHDHSTAYALVMAGTAFVGAGFGTTLPSINVYASGFFPGRTASSLTVLHTLLGLGTALAPFIVALMASRDWWLLPSVMTAALVVLVVLSVWLPLKGPASAGPDRGTVVPAQKSGALRRFFVIVLLYGFCETLFANWANIFLHKEKGLSLAQAGYAMAAFWMAVSAGRLLWSMAYRWIAPATVYRVLPFLMAISMIAVTRAFSPLSGMLFFGLAGFSCSAFFPLTFSFGQNIYAPLAEKISGRLMASYMLGYGLAAYGVGKLLQMNFLTLSHWYLISSMAAVAILILSFFCSI